MIRVILRLQAYVELKNEAKGLNVRMERKIDLPAAPALSMRIRLENATYKTLTVTLDPENTLIEWDDAKQEYVVYIRSMDCLSSFVTVSGLKYFGFEEVA